MGATGSPRARYREQLREEIKQAAKGQLDNAGGAAGLSLNGIARELGMRGPSLYHYFASRDALLDELLLDTYREVLDGMRETVAAARADGLPALQILRRVALDYRGWAIRQPALFDLLYGRPLPGYQAPPETGPLARENLMIMIGLIHEARGSGGDELREIAVRFLARLHGLMTLEVNGHLALMVPDPEGVYTREVDAVLAWTVSPDAP
ncbi:TetR/AcrR family transcriptional regulator [Actinoplanes sp. CA-252034]|uniref:TetR/AcrR family transcriptional regulator n=1 Tax=Actinoplanes sp. CA-252034 TaxID=3239906 RepID=UPI003D97CD88